MFMMKMNDYPRRLAYAMIAAIGLSPFMVMTSSAQSQSRNLPGVSLKISPSSTLIRSDQKLNVSVTVTNASGRTLFVRGGCFEWALAMVSVKDSDGKRPPFKPDARDKMLCSDHGELIAVPNGSSITASESVTEFWDLSQTGVYSLAQSVEIYDQDYQTKYTYKAGPVFITVFEP
jgi:hypothetical protein